MIDHAAKGLRKEGPRPTRTEASLVRKQAPALERVLSRVKDQAAAHAKSKAVPAPAVIIDLDGSAILMRPRRDAVLVQLGAEAGIPEFLHPEALPLVPGDDPIPFQHFLDATGLAQRRPDKDWGSIASRYRELLASQEVELAQHDKVAPGLVEYVRELEEAGAAVYFVTGRHAEKVGDPTLRTLTDAGLTSPRVIFRPEGVPNPEYKAGVAAQIPEEIVAVFDDLQDNRDALRVALPHAEVVEIRHPGITGERPLDAPSQADELLVHTFERSSLGRRLAARAGRVAVATAGAVREAVFEHAHRRQPVVLSPEESGTVVTSPLAGSPPFSARVRLPPSDIGARLTQAWERQPAETRIPAETLRTLVREIPRSNWPEVISADDVRRYLAAQLGLSVEGLQVTPIVVGETAPYVFDVTSHGDPVGVFKVTDDVEQMLTEAGALDQLSRQRRRKLDVPNVIHHGLMEDDRAFLLVERAPGRVLLDDLRAAGAMAGEPRAIALGELHTGLERAAHALASMESSDVPEPSALTVYRDNAICFARGWWQEGAAKLPPARRQALQAQLEDFFARYRSAELGAAFALGDAHPGNLALDGDRWSTFDAAMLYGALGGQGEPLAPTASDAGWFAESFPVYAERYGLTDVEATHATDTFLDAFARASGRTRAELEDDLGFRFGRARHALTNLPNCDESTGDFAAADRLERHTR
jgi:hypothetical protein